MNKYLIKDLMNVNRGSSPRPIIEYLSESGYRWLKISDFNLYDRFVYETKEFIKESGLKNTRHLPAGTLILTNSATPGIPIFLGRDMCLHDGFLYFTNIKENIININYLYYWFLYNRKLIINQANGSVFKNLKKDIVENFEITVPDMNTQLKIVKILDDINRKLELNNKLNNNLYRIIDSIYKNNILDKFEKNHKLSELYYFQYGKGNNNPDNNGIYPVYGSNGIIGGYTEFNNEESPVIGHIGANCGSLIFAFGKHFVTYNGVMCIINNEMYRYFGYVTMRFLNFRNEIRGSSQPFVSYDLLNNMNIPLPDSKVILECEKMFKPVFNIIRNNNNQNCDLEQLRDTLLPKLMNGEIDLDNIEI